jgi:hypothetical protein
MVFTSEWAVKQALSWLPPAGLAGAELCGIACAKLFSELFKVQRIRL